MKLSHPEDITLFIPYNFSLWNHLTITLLRDEQLEGPTEYRIIYVECKIELVYAYKITLMYFDFLTIIPLFRTCVLLLTIRVTPVPY